MADITLTPEEVTAYGLTASETDIADAKQQIHAQTAYTAEEHRDYRAIPEPSIKRAWAIVSDRLRTRTADDAARDLTSESQGDYSYGKRTGAARVYESLLAGTPWELLGLGDATFTTMPPSRRGIDLGFYDDAGVYFPA